MRELLGWLGYLLFIGLGVFGTALAVAWLCVLVDRVPAAAKDVTAGQLRELRRCSAWWAGCLLASLIVLVAMGAI
jgi:hypothetical protein